MAMTRFQKDLSGSNGAYWKKMAEMEIRKFSADVENGEIGVTEEGAAYWRESGNFIPDDACEKLEYTSLVFSRTETGKAREIQTAEFLRNYRHTTTPEELLEMRAAFGPGTTVVDVISGEQIQL